MEPMGKHTVVNNDCENYPGYANKQGSNYPGYTVQRQVQSQCSEVGIPQCKFDGIF